MHGIWIASAALWLGTACAAPHDDGPPLELIDSNLAETPYTAHVHVETVVREPVATYTHSHGGYVTFRVQANVIETFKGAAHPRIDYLQTDEAPSAGPQPGTDLLVSLNERPDGTLYVEDNGYVFPATSAVLRRARNASKRAVPHR